MKLSQITQALPSTITVLQPKMEEDLDYPEIKKITQQNSAYVLSLAASHGRVRIIRTGRTLQLADVLQSLSQKNAEGELFKSHAKIRINAGDTIKLSRLPQSTITYYELMKSSNTQLTISPHSKIRIYDYSGGLEHLRDMETLSFKIKNSILTITNNSSHPSTIGLLSPD